MLSIEKIRQPIAQLCRDLRVVRLDIFGSATTERFTNESDVDVLASFSDSNGIFDRYFTLKENLEALLERPVDLIIEDAIRNPYFRDSIEESRVNVYTERQEETPV